MYATGRDEDLTICKLETLISLFIVIKYSDFKIASDLMVGLNFEFAKINLDRFFLIREPSRFAVISYPEDMARDNYNRNTIRDTQNN